MHVDARGHHHLNEFVVVCLCGADSLAETRAESVEGNVLSITVVLAALSHTFRLTNLRTDKWSIKDTEIFDNWES